MIKHLRNAILAAVIISSSMSSLVGAESAQLSDDKKKQINAYVEKWRSHWNIPTVQIGILENSKLSYEKSFGKQVSDDKTFIINSMSKPMTAYGIMLLVQDGRLSLDDPISKYLPDYEISQYSVTVKNLLNHTSGLTAHDGDNILLSRSYPSVKEAATSIKSLAPDESQINKFQYSNAGYLLLGHIIEKISELDYGTYMKEKVFNPLMMNKTSANNDGSITRGHTSAFSINIPFYSEYDAGSAPYGGIHSTVDDIAKFLEAQSKDFPLQSKYREAMISDKPFVQYYTSPTAYQGLGWAVEPTDTNTKTPLYLFHNGTGRGYQSDMSIEPSTGFGVVILSDKIWYLDDGMFIGSLSQAILDIRQGKQPMEPPYSYDYLRTASQIVAILAVGGLLIYTLKNKHQLRQKKIVQPVPILLIMLGLVLGPSLLYLWGDPLGIVFQYVPDIVVTTLIVSIGLFTTGIVMLTQRRTRK